MVESLDNVIDFVKIVKGFLLDLSNFILCIIKKKKDYQQNRTQMNADFKLVGLRVCYNKN